MGKIATFYFPSFLRLLREESPLTNASEVLQLWWSKAGFNGDAYTLLPDT